MITHTGIIPDDPLEIEPAHIRLVDIGHQLSRINRWNGASGAAFSVAEHSLHAQRLSRVMAPALGARIELLMLIHDAHEAYLGDVIAPIKRQLGPIYGVWARHIDRMVCQVLGIAWPDELERKWVEQIDKQAARIESWSLFPPQVATDVCGPVDVDSCQIHFTCDHGESEWLFQVDDRLDLARVESTQQRDAAPRVTCCQ